MTNKERLGHLLCADPDGVRRTRLYRSPFRDAGQELIRQAYSRVLLRGDVPDIVLVGDEAHALVRGRMSEAMRAARAPSAWSKPEGSQ